MSSTIFTPIQQDLLRLFQYIKNENELTEIKRLITKFYAEKLENHLDTLWDSGVLNQEQLDKINNMDLHKLK